jgi:hypothetical protein
VRTVVQVGQVGHPFAWRRAAAINNGVTDMPRYQPSPAKMRRLALRTIEREAIPLTRSDRMAELLKRNAVALEQAQRATFEQTVAINKRR